MTYRFKGWFLYIRRLRSKDGTEVDAYLFSKSNEPDARPADTLPRAFKIGVEGTTGKPFLRPSRPLGPLLDAWYKKEAGDSLSLEETDALSEAGVDPGVDVAAIRRAVLEQAGHLELAGRFEEAAGLYEKAHAWERAGLARRKAKTHYETRVVQNVQVDLNSLLDQVRAEGLIVPYKCPSCGSGLKISSQTGAAGLHTCSFCGSALDTQLIASYLRQSLG